MVTSLAVRDAVLHTVVDQVLGHRKDDRNMTLPMVVIGGVEAIDDIFGALWDASWMVVTVDPIDESGDGWQVGVTDDSMITLLISTQSTSQTLRGHIRGTTMTVVHQI